MPEVPVPREETVHVQRIVTVQEFRTFFFKDIYSMTGRLVAFNWRRFQGMYYMLFQFNLTDPCNGKWSSVGQYKMDPAPMDRSGFSFTTVNFKGKNRAYLFAGQILAEKSSLRGTPILHAVSDLWYLQGNSDCFSWTEVCPVIRTPGKVYGHTLTLIDDSIFLFGGNIQEPGVGPSPAIPNAWRLQTQRRPQVTWEQYRSLLDRNETSSVFGHSTVAIKVKDKNCLLTFGGFTVSDYGEQSVSKNIILVCAQDFVWNASFKDSETTPVGCLLHSAVVFEDKMYVFGGLTSIHTFTNCSSDHDELWSLNIDCVINEKTAFWTKHTTIGNHPSSSFGHSAVLINNSTEMLVFGGTDGQTVLDDVWLYTLFLNKWTRLRYSWKQSTGKFGRFGHITVVVGMYLIVHGGCILPPPYTNRPENYFIEFQPLPSCPGAGRSQRTMYFDIRRKIWSVLGTENSHPLLFHQAVVLGNEIVIYGGLKSNFWRHFGDATFMQSWHERINGHWLQ